MRQRHRPAPRPRPLRALRALPLAGLLPLMACADSVSDDTSSDDEVITCADGKCDGVTRVVKDLYSDMRRLNLDDLVTLGAGFATSELNDALARLPYVDLKISPTALFGAERRELFGQVVQEDISALQTSLTQRLGEQAFAAQVNKLRLNTLSRMGGGVFAESHFKVGGSFNHSWTVNHGDRVGQVGFTASPTIEAIVIAPYESVTEAMYESPLAALSASQGFILPRSLDEVLKLKAGSSVTLRGSGGIGVNFGVGVPLITGVLVDYLTISSRLSAGARASLSGDVDVQLVRGEGGDVFVDVGLSRQQVRHFELAVESGWGVEGLPALQLEVAGLRVNLADVLKRALERQLNDLISPFDARATSSASEGRLSVARFHFDLLSATPEQEQALAQTLRGDLRLAQALANRPGSGVAQLLDLNKQYERESSYLGFRFLSMRFFTSESVNQGVVYIDEDGVNQELLFSELEQEGGWFFTERGATWRQLTSTRSQGGRPIDAQNNARLTLRERDRFLTKDQILDHVDPLLAYFVGFDGAFNKIGALTDALSTFADQRCGYRPDAGAPYAEREAWDTCVVNLPLEPEYGALVSAAREAAAGLSPRVPDDFAEGFASVSEVTRRLVDLKVGLSGIHDTPNVGLTGPKGALVSQVRFSDDALHDLMSEGAPERLRVALREVLAMMHSDREEPADVKARDALKFAENKASAISNIVRVHAELTKRFAQYDRIAQLEVTPGEGRLSDTAHLLMIPKSNPNDATIGSIARLKGGVVSKLFDQLTSAASGLREPDLYVLGYALLALTRPSEVELMVGFKFDPEHEGGYSRHDVSLYSRGEAAFIDAGQFSVDALIGAQ